MRTRPASPRSAAAGRYGPQPRPARSPAGWTRRSTKPAKARAWTAYEQQTLRLSDISSEPRWPEFCARATQLGVRSMLAIQLYVEGDNLGALNLHSRQVDAFSDESEQVALMFAAHAAVAMAGAQQQEHTVTAVDSRDLIGQAKGILIERYKISSMEVFRLLVVASQNTNIKLYDVAEYLVQTGALTFPKP